MTCSDFYFRRKTGCWRVFQGQQGEAGTPGRWPRWPRSRGHKVSSQAGDREAAGFGSRVVDSFSVCVLHSTNPYHNQAVRDYYPNFTGTLTEVKVFVKSHRTSHYLNEN